MNRIGTPCNVSLLCVAESAIISAEYDDVLLTNSRFAIYNS